MPESKNSHHHAWLHGELSGWVSEGWLTEAVAQRLRDRHPIELEAKVTDQRRARSTHWAMILFGLLGALLVGGGIILLLAHNWDQMSRPARSAVAFVPLVISQALAFWILWTGKGGTVLRETVGTFLALMVGACIALISQTYHVGGDFADFMLVWTLLSLPVAYLLRATLPAIWFCAATVIWGFSVKWDQGTTVLWFWPLLALVVPLWWMEARRDRFHPRPVLIAWAAIGAGCLGVALCSSSQWSGNHWMLAYGGWYALLYLVGRRWFADGRTLWHRPFQVIGVIGAAVIALILTFGVPWRESGPLIPSLTELQTQPWSWLAAFMWPVLAVVFWLESFRRRDIPAAVVGGFPVLIAVAMSLPRGSAASAQALFNAYLFATGVTLLVLGVRRHQLGTVNGGMLILSALVICRFFDSDISFVLRGLVFIALGIGFLVTNIILIKRKGTAA